MKKKFFILLLFFFIFLLILFLINFPKETYLGGFYQSNEINGYHIQISFDKDNNQFVQYIDNREVNKGTFKNTNNSYTLSGDVKNFDFTLEKDNYFFIKVPQLNQGKPIRMNFISNEPSTFDSHFDDVAEYKDLLLEAIE